MISPDMSSQRGCSLNNLLDETRDLKERMRQVLASYMASLKELSSQPEEFERRFWTSRVEALLQTVKTDYESFEAKARKVEFLGKFMTVGIDVVLKAGGMEPIAPLPPAPLGIAISSLGEIRPAILDEPFPQPNAVLVSIERFEAIARRLAEEVMKGRTRPEGEEEIPRLIYVLALQSAKGSSG